MHLTLIVMPDVDLFVPGPFALNRVGYLYFVDDYFKSVLHMPYIEQRGNLTEVILFPSAAQT